MARACTSRRWTVRSTSRCRKGPRRGPSCDCAARACRAARRAGAATNSSRFTSCLPRAPTRRWLNSWPNGRRRIRRTRAGRAQLDMIRETELIAQFIYLERQVLLTWIEEGVISPSRDEEGYLFDRVDESRVALACDLHYRMGLDHASLPVILSLIDQLHDTRHHLRALTRAVAEQPETIRQEITRRMTGDRTSFD